MAPEPPENVTVHLRNGTVIPADCTYEGFHADSHIWLTTQSFEATEVEFVDIPMLPPRSTVQVRLRLSAP